MAHKHNTATDKQMQDFTRHITALFVEKCDKRSYTRPDEVRNSWLYEGEYSAEAEAFLILQTQTYIRNLNSNDPKSTNPDFLKVFIKRIADYLSAYTMRAGKKRKQAKDDLFATLYTNSQYIQLLTEKQEQKRKAGFKRTPERVAAQRKKEAQLAAKRARELHKQVMGEFAEVNTYRKKR
jgi:hypothetical protein